ncbi:hypothetical protein EK904_003764 [Melospiza melodia maxima]|nr:hypothetical protein EK904_003764 [Melospiza melodia maxima]
MREIQAFMQLEDECLGLDTSAVRELILKLRVFPLSLDCVVLSPVGYQEDVCVASRKNISQDSLTSVEMGFCMFLPAEEAQSSPEAPEEPYSLMEWNFLPEEWRGYMSAEFPQGITIHEYIATGSFTSNISEVQFFVELVFLEKKPKETPNPPKPQFLSIASVKTCVDAVVVFQQFCAPAKAASGHLWERAKRNSSSADELLRLCISINNLNLVWTIITTPGALIEFLGTILAKPVPFQQTSESRKQDSTHHSHLKATGRDREQPDSEVLDTKTENMTMEKTITEPPVVTTCCKNKTSASQHEIRKDPWETLNATEPQIRLPQHYFECSSSLLWEKSFRDNSSVNCCTVDGLSTDAAKVTLIILKQANWTTQVEVDKACLVCFQKHELIRTIFLISVTFQKQKAFLSNSPVYLMRFAGTCTEVFVVRFVHREAMLLTAEEFIFWN